MKMDAFQTSMLKYMAEIKLEMSNIKNDISDIKHNINVLKMEHDEFMKAFPDGIATHCNDHAKKKKWFLF